MAKAKKSGDKKTKAPQEQMRPLIDESSKVQPLKQIYNGFEIEKRQVLLTVEQDHSKKGNAISIYNDILKEGVEIHQGYVKDINMAVEMLNELGVVLKDFKPNTIRLRKFGPGFKDKGISKCKYVLTLKDKKETKKREVEFKLSPTQFEKFWPQTEGARVHKKRMRKTIKGFDFELDAFLDRILLIIECEVSDEAEIDKVPTMGMDITNQKNWSNKALSK